MPVPTIVVPSAEMPCASVKVQPVRSRPYWTSRSLINSPPFAGVQRTARRALPALEYPTTILPLALTATAVLLLYPAGCGSGVMVPPIQRKARVWLLAFSEYPTTTEPSGLTPRASPSTSPDSTPRPVGVPLTQRTGWLVLLLPVPPTTLV